MMDAHGTTPPPASTFVEPFEGHKSVCFLLAPDGWTYTGFDSPFYLFQSGNYSTGFREMKCLQEDLTTDNVAYMAEQGLSRV